MANGYGINASFVVIGLTDGGSFRANPCVGTQVTAAKTRHLWTSAYAISTYPTAAQLARYGGTGTLSTRLGRVGTAEASFNLATMTRIGLRPTMIWVDIEPRKLFPWSASTANNNAVITAVLARYRAAGVPVGIYSYTSAWKSITANRALPGVPTWFPVGRSGYAAAMSRCSLASFSGSKPWLVQWTDGVSDYDRTCPGVTGSLARGHVLTPYLNVSWRPARAGLRSPRFSAVLADSRPTGCTGR